MRQPYYFLARLPRAVFRRIGKRFSTAVHRLALDHVGENTHFEWGCRLLFSGTARIGHDCRFASGVEIGTDIVGVRLEIGNNVQLNRNVHLDVTGGLTIDDGVLVSENVIIYTHDHGLDPRSIPEGIPKQIGSNVWIGMRAIVLADCTSIGAGAVIGAGAIVTRDVEANAIVAGNPARVIGWRAQEKV